MTGLLKIWLIVWHLVVLSVGTGLASPFETEEYRELQVHGWLLRVSPEYADDELSLRRAIGEVDRQLGNIARSVPEAALSKLRRTVFWLEYRRDDPQRSVYHRSAGWLRKNGYNPDKANGIEIDAGIVTREQIAPWSLLHELAHAYFDVVLERNSDELEIAYKAAVESGIYQDVLRNSGRRQPAYALNSVSEYFAELSEAYFGENDFEPFTRDQLRTFDPAGYESLEHLWSKQ